jgi:hypothetical protein
MFKNTQLLHMLHASYFEFSEYIVSQILSRASGVWQSWDGKQVNDLVHTEEEYKRYHEWMASTLSYDHGTLRVVSGVGYAMAKCHKTWTGDIT